ncbi:pseudouridylate synthase [[Clostridium] ultunense Esp]|uniref:Pseudouridine synthase n=1 Tax=[Clostridium] ultunense Esp TaxID=1288971 RepID=M1YZL6_9FIRM|nr:RluA family pseudouridine synthase [Schnuerera ultunensis]CCQ96045.1 pseudouridylate synthase [[Clostridium] ultunense Esp]SHD76939.1 pseudouridylate synthase [[Clostridium] ultunense Esp]
MELLEFYVEDTEGERLDSYLAFRLNNVSRSYLQKLIKEGLVLVNGNGSKARYRVKIGDYIQIKLPEQEQEEPIPENLPLDIIYEDKDIVIVNKPEDMVVHPAPGNPTGTLVNALLYHVDSLYSGKDIIRPGIVHRLDKDTSGLLAVAKNEIAYNSLIQQLKNRSMERVYEALVYGVLNSDEGTINVPIGRHPVDRKRMTVRKENGKEAITHFKALEKFQDYTLLEASLETGRTHQIRVHMAYINHPIVGETVYSKRKNEFGLKSQLLHAKKLGFVHPRRGKYMEFEIELPVKFKKVLEILRERNR